MAIYDIDTLKQTYSDQFYATLLALLEAGGGGSTSDLSGPRLTLIGQVMVKIDEMMSQAEGTSINLNDVKNSNVIHLYINALLDECSKHVLQTAPLHVIEPADGGEITPVDNSDGSGYIDLPSDYLRFVSFKMNTWLQENNEPIVPDNLNYKLQRYEATRGGIAKPVCVLNSRVSVQTPEAKVQTITLLGSTGTANISVGGVERLATFDTSLEVTATNFVTLWATPYLAAGIAVTSSGDDLIFTANVAGTDFTSGVILNVTTDLTGSIVTTQANVPAREGIRTLEYYSLVTGTTHTLSKFLYVANVGAEYIQTDLYDALTWLCAAKVLQIWGQTSGNGSYAENAMKQVELCYQNLM